MLHFLKSMTKVPFLEIFVVLFCKISREVSVIYHANNIKYKKKSLTLIYK